MLLLPAIDLRHGRCVRLLRGDFGAETRYDCDPHELLDRYRTMGASWLHLVDLDGAKDGVAANRDIVIALASVRQMRLQVGGGVRSAVDIDDLLRHGVARVVIGSAAVERPVAVAEWLRQFGVERLCLAFDVRFDQSDIPLVRTRGWTETSTLSLWEAIARFPPGSFKHILCTDIDCDGTLNGPNTQLYREAMARFPQVAWQASGGVRNVSDLAELAQIGVAAAVSGKALLEDRITPEELRPYLQDASSPVSMSGTAKS